MHPIKEPAFLSPWRSLLLIAFKLYDKYLVHEKKCTAKTVGMVVWYTLVTRGEEKSPVCLPVVVCAVNEKKNKIVGLEYNGYQMLGGAVGLFRLLQVSCFQRSLQLPVFLRKNQNKLRIERKMMMKSQNDKNNSKDTSMKKETSDEEKENGEK